MEQTAAHRGVGCRRLEGETGERLWGVGRTSSVDIMIRTHFIHRDRPAATGGGLRARQGPLPRQYMHNKENAVTMRLSAH